MSSPSESDRPYRFVGRLKNNRLWSSILELYPEVQTQSDAAKLFGTTSSVFGALLNMKWWPHSHRFGWARLAVRISEMLGQPLDWLFDPELYGHPPPPRIEVELKRLELPGQDLKLLPPTQDDQVFEDERKEAVRRALRTLTPREEKVIKQRFGLEDGEEMDLQEVGKGFAISPERVRQIEAKALRKLRHPTRSQRLKPLLEDLRIKDENRKIWLERNQRRDREWRRQRELEARKLDS